MFSDGRKLLKRPNPGPPEGLGRMVCYMCGKPVRDHKITAYCPELVKIDGHRRVSTGSARETRHEPKAHDDTNNKSSES